MSLEAAAFASQSALDYAMRNAFYPVDGRVIGRKKRPFPLSFCLDLQCIVAVSPMMALLDNRMM